jgi:hypothetical protein
MRQLFCLSAINQYKHRAQQRSRKVHSEKVLVKQPRARCHFTLLGIELFRKIQNLRLVRGLMQWRIQPPPQLLFAHQKTP